MSLARGEQNIGKIYRGTNSIGKIYRGATLVFSANFAPEVQLMPYYIDGDDLSRVNRYKYISTGTYSSGTYYEYNINNYSYDVKTLASGDSLVGLYTRNGLDNETIVAYAVGNGVTSANVFNKTGTIRIPSTFNGLPIETINDYAFKNEILISDFSLPNTIKYIGFDTMLGTGFYADNSNWSNSLLKIGTFIIDAFGGLTTANIDTDITVCASQCFGRCKLTAINFNATNCNDFYNSKGAFFYREDTKKTGGYPDTTLNIGSNVRYLPSYLLRSGSKYDTSYQGGINSANFVIPNSITNVGSFGLMANFNKILSNPFVIPSNVSYMGKYTIGTRPTKQLDIRASMIPNEFMYNPSGVLTVGEDVETLTIGSGVASIGELAFPVALITTMRFNQPNGMLVVLPVAGSGTGMFYNKTARNITIYVDNQTIHDYDWAGDNITPTFYHLNGTAW